MAGLRVVDLDWFSLVEFSISESSDRLAVGEDQLPLDPVSC